MAKLKLLAVEDDRPVKLTVELPAAVHRDLVAYAEVCARQNGQKTSPPNSSRRCWRGSCRRIEPLYAHDEKSTTQWAIRFLNTPRSRLGPACTSPWPRAQMREAELVQSAVDRVVRHRQPEGWFFT